MIVSPTRCAKCGRRKKFGPVGEICSECKYKNKHRELVQCVTCLASTWHESKQCNNCRRSKRKRLASNESNRYKCQTCDDLVDTKGSQCANCSPPPTLEEEGMFEDVKFFEY